MTASEAPEEGGGREDREKRDDYYRQRWMRVYGTGEVEARERDKGGSGLERRNE